MNKNKCLQLCKLLHEAVDLLRHIDIMSPVLTNNEHSSIRFVTCFLNDKYKSNSYILMKRHSDVAVIFESLHRSVKQKF